MSMSLPLGLGILRFRSCFQTLCSGDVLVRFKSLAVRVSSHTDQVKSCHRGSGGAYGDDGRCSSCESGERAQLRLPCTLRLIRRMHQLWNYRSARLSWTDNDDTATELNGQNHYAHIAQALRFSNEIGRYFSIYLAPICPILDDRK